MKSIIDKIEFKHIMALSIVFFSFLVMTLMLIWPRANTHDYSIQILTGILSMDSTVLALWFNASLPDKKKDEEIKRLNEQLNGSNSTTINVNNPTS